eukprot:m.526797 g.526797  ORF g.526797 m.526797 type:complete len:74 (+) comp22005_c1_seq3:46-267(+)
MSNAKLYPNSDFYTQTHEEYCKQHLHASRINNSEPTTTSIPPHAHPGRHTETTKARQDVHTRNIQNQTHKIGP